METQLNLSESTPMWQLTLGQFLKIIDSRLPKEKSETPKPAEHRYVRGLQGITSLFGCSRPTALKLKNTIIKDAVSQNGRIIITDVEKAIQLFREYQILHPESFKTPSK